MAAKNPRMAVKNLRDDAHKLCLEANNISGADDIEYTIYDDSATVTLWAPKGSVNFICELAHAQRFKSQHITNRRKDGEEVRLSFDQEIDL